MKRFGLIGHPIAHSLSPALFKAAYNGRYTYGLIETEDFETAYGRFLESYDGINVTAPFKEDAYAKADILSDECNIICAANILLKTPDGIKAYNSDYLGVRMWLDGILHQEEPATAAKHARTALIAGLGGAGKAAATAAAESGLHCILMNRSMDKAVNLAERLMSDGHCVRVHPLKDFAECFFHADIIIYCIPEAINELDLLPESGVSSDAGRHILEAGYRTPAFTEAMLTKLKNNDPRLQYTDGRTWLLYQALSGYEIFTGEKPDLSKMYDVL